jgi:hypothetical protein
VEPHHPVADNLQRHPADPGGLAACATIVDRGQSQQAPHLRPVLRGLGCRPHLRGIEVSPKQNGHREPQSFATLNQIAAPLNSQEAGFQELGIRSWIGLLRDQTPHLSSPMIFKRFLPPIDHVATVTKLVGRRRLDTLSPKRDQTPRVDFRCCQIPKAVESHRTYRIAGTRGFRLASNAFVAGTRRRMLPSFPYARD